MKRVGLFLLAVGMVTGLSGCPGGENEWNCRDSHICARNGQTVKACCNKALTRCEFKIGDQTFPCDGTDCNDAVITISDYCKR